MGHINDVVLYGIPKRTCETNPMSEKNSFILTVCSKSVSLYHFKLDSVVLHLSVKESFETHIEKSSFNLDIHFRSSLIVSCSLPVNWYPKLPKIYFLLQLCLQQPYICSVFILSSKS